MPQAPAKPPIAPNLNAVIPSINAKPSANDMQMFADAQTRAKNGSTNTAARDLGSFPDIGAKIAGSGAAKGLEGAHSEPVRKDGPAYSQPPRFEMEPPPAVPEQAQEAPIEAPAPATPPPDPNRAHVPSEDTLEALRTLAGTRSKESVKEPPATNDEAPLEQLTTPKQLREAFERTRKKNLELETQVKQAAALEEKLKQLEAANVNGPLTEQIETLQKRIEEYESKLRVSDYTKSEEFQEKHVKPLELAFKTATDLLKELPVQMEGGTERPATEADLRHLLSLNPSAAHKTAVELFGNFGGAEVMNSYREIRRLDRTRQEALNNAHIAAEEAARRAAVEAETSHAKSMSVYTQSRAKLLEEYPDLFGERADDAEGNALVQRQRASIESLLKGEGLTPEERIKGSARVHEQAANYPRALLDLKRAREETESLRKRLAAYEQSDPGETDLGGTSPAPKNEEYDPMKELAKIGSRRSTR